MLTLSLNYWLLFFVLEFVFYFLKLSVNKKCIILKTGFFCVSVSIRFSSLGECHASEDPTIVIHIIIPSNNFYFIPSHPWVVRLATVYVVILNHVFSGRVQLRVDVVQPIDYKHVSVKPGERFRLIPFHRVSTDGNVVRTQRFAGLRHAQKFARADGSGGNGCGGVFAVGWRLFW